MLTRTIRYRCMCSLGRALAAAAILIAPLALAPMGTFMPVAAVVEDRSADTAGRASILDFPDLDHVGERLRAPKGWAYRQVNAEELAELRARFGVEKLPAVAYLDRFENLLLLDDDPAARGRLDRGCVEAERRARDWTQRFAKLWSEALDFRATGKDARELAKLHELSRAQVVGYEEVVAARARLRELDAERRREFRVLMAAEGLLPGTKLAEKLRELAARSTGLGVEAEIERDAKRLEQGLLVVRPAPRTAR